jgi:hypothetical protein
MLSYIQSTLRVVQPVPAPAGAQETWVQQFWLETQDNRVLNWCWAAVAHAVERHYQPWSAAAHQCEVASRTLGHGCCPPQAACDVQIDLARALQAVHHYGGTDLPVGSYDALWRAVPDLLCARIEDSRRGGHFVAIAGAWQTAQDQMIVVGDPKYTAYFVCKFSVFRNGYPGNGHWTHTYRTQ